MIIIVTIPSSCIADTIKRTSDYIDDSKIQAVDDDAKPTTTKTNSNIDNRKAVESSSIEGELEEKKEEEEGHCLYYSNKDKEGSPQKPNYSSQKNEEENQSYIILGVSGGLQDGFPDHNKLDYHDVDDDIVVPAIYLGRGLVRGYKAYLDVMQPNWRQYVAEDDKDDEASTSKATSTTTDEEAERQHARQKVVTINSNVIASGCYHHANEYWMYLVDSRQVLTTLMNEPRFLSISPDLGLVDLITKSSSTTTSDLVRHFAYELIKEQSKVDFQYVAFPIVTAAWYNPRSHIPSPIVEYHDDGTQVTNFPYSLAKWADIDLSSSNRNTNITTTTSNDNSSTFENTTTMMYVDGSETTQVLGYWDKVRKSIRQAEKYFELQQNKGLLNQPNRQKNVDVDGDDDDDDDFPPFRCKKKARFGVSKDMARINYPLSKQKIRSIIMEYNSFSPSSSSDKEEGGDDSSGRITRTNHESYDIDFERGTIIITTTETKKHKQGQ